MAIFFLVAPFNITNLEIFIHAWYRTKTYFELMKWSKMKVRSSNKKRRRHVAAGHLDGPADVTAWKKQGPKIDDSESD